MSRPTGRVRLRPDWREAALVTKPWGGLVIQRADSR
jgi:hypothetical protein